MSEGPIILDVMGLRCPIPVQRVRLMLKEIEGGTIHLLGDDPESLHDIPALLDRLGLPPATITQSGDSWRYVITKPNET